MRAMLTGAWAMPLIGLGLACTAMPLVVFVYIVAQTFGQQLAGDISLYAVVSGFFAALIAALFGLIAILVVPWFGIVPFIVGVTALIGGFWGSIAALRGQGVAAPRSVTWRAALLGCGIAFGLNVLNAAIGYGIALALNSGAAEMHYAFAPASYPIAAVVYYVLSALTLIGVGMVVWPATVRRAA